MSATGTSFPVTWHVLLPKWNSVRSVMRGASRQPESVTTFRASSGAPHRAQVVLDGSFCARHQLQTTRSTDPPHWLRLPGRRQPTGIDLGGPGAREAFDVAATAALDDGGRPTVRRGAG